MYRKLINVVLPIIGVIAGIVTAMATVTLVEAIPSRMYPLPPGVDPHDYDALRQHIKTLPITALLLVLIAWWLGTLTGGWVAAAIVGRQPAIWCAIIAAVMFAVSLYMLAVIPHPMWFGIAALIGIPWFAWLAARLTPIRTNADAAPAASSIIEPLPPAD